MTTRYDDDENVIPPHPTSKHQYYAQWGFERVYIVTETI